MGESTLSWNPADDVRQLLHYPFMVHAFAAGTIVAIVAGLIGWYVTLRRQTFAAHTIAVMSFPGAAGAALASLPIAFGYYLACALAGVAIGAGRRVRSRESATIGAVQVAGLALGFLFLGLYGGVLEDLETLLFGSFLGIDTAQVLTLLAVAGAVLVTLALVGRPLLLASLDLQVARAWGLPVRALDMGFMLLLALAVAAISQLTGALLVFALLVAPAAAAQTLTGRPGLGLLVSVTIALAVVWGALALAYFSIYPLGFFVSSLAFTAYLLAKLGRAIAMNTRARRAMSLDGGRMSPAQAG
ncbi:MAG TPA: metal ABC transporter permease [Solirubrobacteraceae bacterium]|nr:metal ABC transporter permease [Solirubrobacteraceae bacterium]